MARKSIGELHATVSADASQFVEEFRRADATAKQRAASIRGQVDKLGNDLSKSFSLAKFGKDLLGGFGVGSAAGLTMRLVDHFVDMWRESEEYAKKLDERAQSIADAMKRGGKEWGEMVRGMRPADERRDMVNQEIARMSSLVDIEEDRRQKAMRGLAFATNEDNKGFGVRIRSFGGEDFAGGKDNPGMQVKAFSDLMSERADDAQKRIQQIRDEMRPLVQEIVQLNESLTKEAEKAQAAQEDLRVKQITMTGRGGFRFAEAATPDDLAAAEARGSAEVRRMMEERRTKSEQLIDRVEKEANRSRVDEYTKRGMGSGANYRDVMRENANVLRDIKRILENAISSGSVSMGFGT